MELIASPLDQPRLQLGESPRWDARHKLLALVDLHEHCVVFMRGDHVETIPMPGRTGFIAPRAAGGWLVSVDGGLRVLDEARQLGAEFCRVAPDGLRINDGRCDVAGRLWVGTYGDRWDVGACAFYRVEKTSVLEVFHGITCSNGLGWSPDGRKLYYVDSGTWRVDACAFDLETGTISDQRPAIAIPQAEGVPDGITVDAAGMIWVALFNPPGAVGQVWRCDPATGAVLGRVIVPGTGAVTACAFGGDDLSELYITAGGGVFHVRAPVAGQLEHPWKGHP